MKSTPVSVFGWRFTQQLFADAEEFKNVWLKDTPVESSANWLFWTRGARVVISYPEELDDPFFIEQRGQFCNKTTFAGHVYKKGSYTYKAVGETELWCFDYLLNDNSNPDMQLTFVPAGQDYITSVGQLLFIPSGETNLGTGPISVVIATEGQNVTAITDTAIITISRRKQ